jgi:hypothetical protein
VAQPNLLNCDKSKAQVVFFFFRFSLFPAGQVQATICHLCPFDNPVQGTDAHTGSN